MYLHAGTQICLSTVRNKAEVNKVHSLHVRIALNILPYAWQHQYQRKINRSSKNKSDVPNLSKFQTKSVILYPYWIIIQCYVSTDPLCVRRKKRFTEKDGQR